MSKLTKLTISIFAVWLIIVAVATSLTFVTASIKVTDDVDLMVQAATLASKCQQAIKQEKANRGIDTYPLLDTLDTGMLGIPSVWQYLDYYQDGTFEHYEQTFEPLLAITTTDGDLFSKRTSCDPNWAALMISLYRRAGLKAGDQVGMTFSGSFPAMNIAALVSAQVYGLKVCAMSGIGASYCGANDPRFTFVEMVNLLCEQGLLTHGIDYLSWGGEDDVLDNRYARDPNAKPHLQRIKDQVIAPYEANSSFIYQSNFDDNVDLRISYLSQDLPKIKMFVNVGGSMAGLGTGFSSFNRTGYFKGGKVYSPNRRSHNQGLLQYYKESGLPVVNMINFHQLATTYNVPYADDEMVVAPQIGLTEYNVQQGYYSFYYQTAYNPVYAVIALALSCCLAVLYALARKKYGPTTQRQSRNHLLNQR